MKFGFYVTVFSILVAIGYGVLFSYMYPLVPIDGGLVGLCAILGLATSLMVVAAMRFLAKAVHSTKGFLLSAASRKISNKRQYFYASSGERTTAAKVFISYRRDDAAAYAGRIEDRLKEEFGRDNVFMDVGSILLGVNFFTALNEAVAQCEVLLAVIGRNWVSAHDIDGKRRLDNPNDFVRIEIASALQRKIPVIPILIDGATIPEANQLPEDLKELALRNGMEIRHVSFQDDMNRLIRGLKGRMGPSQC
jgi:hypothetical protein